MAYGHDVYIGDVPGDSQDMNGAGETWGEMNLFSNSVRKILLMMQG